MTLKRNAYDEIFKSACSVKARILKKSQKNLLKDWKGQSEPLQFFAIHFPFTSHSSSGNSPNFLGKAGFLHVQPMHFQVRLTHAPRLDR